MPDLNITADKIIGKSLYTNSTVNAYNYPGEKVVNTYNAKSFMGVVDTYIIRSGQVWWGFKDANGKPYYILHSSRLELPGKEELLKQQTAAQDAAERESKGLLQYNIDKYGKWIIGGVVVAVALPTVIQLLKGSGKSAAVSGVKDNKGLLLLLLLGGAAIILKKKKLKGSVEVGPLDEGEFVIDSISYDATKFPGII